MENEPKFRKAFNFDLKMKLLDENYSGSRSQAYLEIKDFFESRNFEHVQYSGYISNEKLSTMEMTEINSELYDKFDWLFACAADAKITNVIDITNSKELYLQIKEIELRRKNRFNNSIESPEPDVPDELTDELGDDLTDSPTDSIEKQQAEPTSRFGTFTSQVCGEFHSQTFGEFTPGQTPVAQASQIRSQQPQKECIGNPKIIYIVYM